MLSPTLITGNNTTKIETRYLSSDQNGSHKPNGKYEEDMSPGNLENIPKPTQSTDEYSIELTRQQKLYHYLPDVKKAGEITSSTTKIAWEAWCSLYYFMDKRLPVPDAGTGPDGQLLYVWDKGMHHFEMEIFPDAPAEFFYLNRETDETWELDYIIGEPLNIKIKTWLGLCV